MFDFFYCWVCVALPSLKLKGAKQKIFMADGRESIDCIPTWDNEFIPSLGKSYWCSTMGGNHAHAHVSLHVFIHELLI